MDSCSAVVPFYNDEATIARALSSVADQTRPPDEIIVVDDASRPDQAAALDELAAAWSADLPPLRVLHQPRNAGPGDARNAGWEVATGEWVAFCDADDVWHPEHLAVLGAVTEGADLIACPYAPTPEEMAAPAPGEQPRVSAITLRQLLVLNPILMSSVLVRRSIGPRFTPGRRYTEDYELWLRIVASGVGRFVHHPLAAAQYTPEEASGLTTHRWAMTRGEWESFRLVRADGAISRGEYVFALAVSGLRAVRRHGLLALRGLRQRFRR